MTKTEFLTRLRDGLKGLPQEDIEERVRFYAEMIEDRMEEGLAEEEAVKEIGDVERIIEQIIAETPLKKIVKENVKSKRSLHAWEVVLLILGSPIWLTAGIVLLSILFCIGVAIWSVVLVCFAVEVAVVVFAIGCIASAIGLIFHGNAITGLATLGAGFVALSLPVFLFFICKAILEGALYVTRKVPAFFKHIFCRKGNVK